MSAVEALAEVLRDHAWDRSVAQCTCGRSVLDDGAFRLHRASVLVAAIRSMPAEQVAELIGGKVELAGGEIVKVPGEWLPTIEWETCRVVTPWLPLGVSPETNGEQK